MDIRGLIPVFAIVVNACGNAVGPSQVQNYSGAWTGELKYATCDYSGSCAPKTCYWAAEYSVHMRSDMTLTVRQSNNDAAADLVMEDHHIDIPTSTDFYRYTAAMAGSTKNGLSMTGDYTRRLIGSPLPTPFDLELGRVQVKATLATDGSRGLSGTLTKLIGGGGECLVGTQWSFDAVAATP